MNTKDAEVHAMARQLAAMRGTSVTDAVRQALSAELERHAKGPEVRAAAARCEKLLSLLPRFQQLLFSPA